MNILLISQAYPPYPVVGSARARKLADAFRGRGHNVVVITERLPGEGPGLRIDEPDLRVHTVALGELYRLRAVRLFRGLGRLAGRSRAAGNSDAPAPGPAPRGGEGWLRRLVLGLLRLPDDEQRFIIPAWRAARAVQRELRVDAVYTTAPTFSSHIVGLLLRRFGRVPWVAEFRDPWTDQRTRGPADATAPVEALHRWLERACLRAADRVVTVTEGTRQALARKVPTARRGKFVLALNGIEQLDPPAPPATRKPRRIVYAGTFYHHRDPRPFLAALAAVRARHGLGPGDVQVDFFGERSTWETGDIPAFLREHGLDDVVNLSDWLDDEEVRAVLRDASLLLLIALAQPLQVPNKLFDYLGTRRPIFAIVDAGGETEAMLRRLDGHFIVPVPPGQSAEPKAIEAALERWLAADGEDAAEGTTARGAEDVLQGWLGSRQLAHVVDAVEELAGSDAAMPGDTAPPPGPAAATPGRAAAISYQRGL